MLVGGAQTGDDPLDVSDARRDLVLSGGVTTNASKSLKGLNAIEFDGVDDYVQMKASEALAYNVIHEGDFSLTIYFEPASLDKKQVLFQQGSGDPVDIDPMAEDLYAMLHLTEYIYDASKNFTAALTNPYNIIFGNIWNKFGASGLYINFFNDHGYAARLEGEGGTNTVNLGNNYTIEAWLYPTQDFEGDKTAWFASCDLVYTNDCEIMDTLELGSSHYRVNNTADRAIGPLIGSTWQHMAFTNDGSTIRSYINGISTGDNLPVSNSISYLDGGFVLGGGLYDSVGSPTYHGWYGGIQNFRITRGVRYTSNFTPDEKLYWYPSDIIAVSLTDDNKIMATLPSIPRTTPTVLKGTTTIQTGQSYEARLEVDGTTATLYLDGNIEAQMTIPKTTYDARDMLFGVASLDSLSVFPERYHFHGWASYHLTEGVSRHEGLAYIPENEAIDASYITTIAPKRYWKVEQFRTSGNPTQQICDIQLLDEGGTMVNTMSATTPLTTFTSAQVASLSNGDVNDCITVGNTLEYLQQDPSGEYAYFMWDLGAGNEAVIDRIVVHHGGAPDYFRSLHLFWSEDGVNWQSYKRSPELFGDPYTWSVNTDNWKNPYQVSFDAIQSERYRYFEGGRFAEQFQGGVGHDGPVYLNSFKHSGKWYFEFLWYANSSGGSHSIGLCDMRLTNYCGFSSNGLGMESQHLRIGAGPAITNPGYISALDNAWRRIMIAIDFDAKLLWIGENGTWLSGGDPAVGTSPHFAGWTQDHPWSVAVLDWQFPYKLVSPPPVDVIYEIPEGYELWNR